MTDGTTIPTSTTTIRSKDGEDDGGDEVMGAEDGTATTTTMQLMGATATGWDMTTRGREMTQQPSKRTNKRTNNNQSGDGTAGEAATRGGRCCALFVARSSFFCVEYLLLT